MPSKTLGPQSAQLVTTLYDQLRPLFRVNDVEKICDLSAASSRRLIHELIGRGIVNSLQPGLYQLIPYELGHQTYYAGNPYTLVSELIRGEDYFISHAAAMQLHQMTTQPQFVVYVSTTHQYPRKNILGTEYNFVCVKSSAFFGVQEIWVSKTERVIVSDLERTIIDGLYQPHYCGGISEVVKAVWMQREKLNSARLIEYALKLNVGAVIRRLGFIMDICQLGSVENLNTLQEKLTPTYVLLDPSLLAEGKYLKKWRIRQNISTEELKMVGAT